MVSPPVARSEKSLRKGRDEDRITAEKRRRSRRKQKRRGGYPRRFRFDVR
jgi:hypothetical protein